jgi:hypothetical protein
VTFFWLLFWVCSGAPDLHQWNGWAVALVVCALVDIFSGTETVRTRQRRRREDT